MAVRSNVLSRGNITTPFTGSFYTTPAQSTTIVKTMTFYANSDVPVLCHLYVRLSGVDVQLNDVSLEPLTGVYFPLWIVLRPGDSIRAAVYEAGALAITMFGTVLLGVDANIPQAPAAGLIGAGDGGMPPP